jgi:Leucine-rich repeat (LRR) protein
VAREEQDHKARGWASLFTSTWHTRLNTLQNLDNLIKLRLLSIQSNRITKIEGLENLANLEELYFSHNGIKKLEGLEHNVCLAILFEALLMRNRLNSPPSTLATTKSR